MKLYKGDTFFLHGEIMCVMDIQQKSHRQHDTFRGISWYEEYTAVTCEDVQEQDNPIEYTLREVLAFIKNPNDYNQPEAIA